MSGCMSVCTRSPFKAVKLKIADSLQTSHFSCPVTDFLDSKLDHFLWAEQDSGGGAQDSPQHQPDASCTPFTLLLQFVHFCTDTRRLLTSHDSFLIFHFARNVLKMTSSSSFRTLKVRKIAISLIAAAVGKSRRRSCFAGATHRPFLAGSRNWNIRRF